MDTYLASVSTAARTGWLQLNGVQGGLMAAAKLMVMYPPPKDVPTFERLYLDEHVPMAIKKLAGKTKIVATKVQSSPQGKPAFHRIAGFISPPSRPCKPAPPRPVGRRRWRMRPRSPRAVRLSS